MSVGKNSISRMGKAKTAEAVKTGIVSLAPEVPAGTPAAPAKETTSVKKPKTKAAAKKAPAKKTPAASAKKKAKKAEKPAPSAKAEKNGFVRVSVGDAMPYYLL